MKTRLMIHPKVSWESWRTKCVWTSWKSKQMAHWRRLFLRNSWIYPGTPIFFISQGLSLRKLTLYKVATTLFRAHAKSLESTSVFGLDLAGTDPLLKWRVVPVSGEHVGVNSQDISGDVDTTMEESNQADRVLSPEEVLTQISRMEEVTTFGDGKFGKTTSLSWF